MVSASCVCDRHPPVYVMLPMMDGPTGARGTEGAATRETFAVVPKTES